MGLPYPPPSNPSVLAGTLPRVHPPSGLSLLVGISIRTSPKPGFDTICNGSNPPLADIVFFGLSLLGFLSRFLKMRLLGRVFHTLIKNVLFSSQPWDLPLNVGFFSFSSPLLQFLYVFSQKFGVTLVNR